MRSFHTALFQANLLYGIELSEDQFDEYALIAWNLIGNHRVRLYHYIAEVNCDGNYIDLPCNCDIIEAVTNDWEDWNYTSNVLPHGDYETAHIEQYIEARKALMDPLYISGHFVKYERVGDRLYFHKNFGRVHVLYYGQVLDDDGLPELTEEEINAIAAFVAYAVKYKEGIATNNANLLQIANMLKADWAIKCDQARVPSYINQNDMNKILDARTTWTRKVYGKSYKPVM
jgi:hypothetical protein